MKPRLRMRADQAQVDAVRIAALEPVDIPQVFALRKVLERCTFFGWSRYLLMFDFEQNLTQGRGGVR